VEKVYSFRQSAITVLHNRWNATCA